MSFWGKHLVLIRPRYSHAERSRPAICLTAERFAGAEVTTGKVASWVPPPDPARLHLSQVHAHPYATLVSHPCPY